MVESYWLGRLEFFDGCRPFSDSGRSRFTTRSTFSTSTIKNAIRSAQKNKTRQYADDGCDIGEDSGAPVSPDYAPSHNRFSGEVKGVQLAIDDAVEAANNLVDPAKAVAIAMARQ